MCKRFITLLLLGVLIGSGCATRDDDADWTELRVWAHQGQESENRAMREMVDAFNEAHEAARLRVQITFFPDYQYTERISIAAAARDMPDAFDLDGPTVAQFVDANLLAPLNDHFSATELDDFLDTIIAQGTIDGTLYAVGAFDSALVLYYDKALFEKAGVTPAEPDQMGWTWDEFLEACDQLLKHGIEPVALHMDVTADEWYTYAFSPLIWSGGGSLIDAERGQVAGVLDAPINVATLTRWQELFERGFAARAPINPDPFGAGMTAMDWSGHWMARSHIARKGERLGVMPLPRMGDQPAAACGSWCWAISANSSKQEAAAKWVHWVTDPERGIQPMVSAGGAVPSRHSAFEFFPEFEEPPYSVFRELLTEAGRPRPQTPFYPNLTQHFAAALRDIAQGADVEQRLSRSADAVQRIIDRRAGGGT